MDPQNPLFSEGTFLGTFALFSLVFLNTEKLLTLLKMMSVLVEEFLQVTRKDSSLLKVGYFFYITLQPSIRMQMSWLPVSIQYREIALAETNVEYLTPR